MKTLLDDPDSNTIQCLRRRAQVELKEERERRTCFLLRSRSKILSRELWSPSPENSASPLSSGEEEKGAEGRRGGARRRGRGRRRCWEGFALLHHSLAIAFIDISASCSAAPTTRGYCELPV